MRCESNAASTPVSLTSLLPSYSLSLSVSHDLQLTLQNSSSQPVELLDVSLERGAGADGAELLSCRPEQLQQQLPLAAGAAARLTVTVTAGGDFVVATEEDDEGGEREGLWTVTHTEQGRRRDQRDLAPMGFCVSFITFMVFVSQSQHIFFLC